MIYLNILLICLPTCYILLGGQSVTLVTVTLVTEFLCPRKKSMKLSYLISTSKFSVHYQLSQKKIYIAVCMPE